MLLLPWEEGAGGGLPPVCWLWLPGRRGQAWWCPLGGSWVLAASLGSSAPPRAWPGRAVLVEGDGRCSGSQGLCPGRARPHPAQGGTGEPVLCFGEHGAHSWRFSGRGTGRGGGLSLSAPGPVLNLGSSVLARAHPVPHSAMMGPCDCPSCECSHHHQSPGMSQRLSLRSRGLGRASSSRSCGALAGGPG